MKYVIELLEHDLEMEKKYRETHSEGFDANKSADEGSDEWAFSESVRLANERIPQLEAAIKKLSENAN